MQYRYFVDFRHGVSVFANFSYGFAVLGTPNVPLNNLYKVQQDAVGAYIWASMY